MLTQICRDRDQAECWHLGLTALISCPYSPASSVGSKSSRQMASCASTPRSYIQRKSKLSAVYDTPRLRQVRSRAYMMLSKWTLFSFQKVSCDKLYLVVFWLAYLNFRFRSWSNMIFSGSIELYQFQGTILCLCIMQMQWV
jgi:hypothetical protein